MPFRKIASRVRRELRVLQYVWRDPRTPWHARWLVAAVVAYAISPIDLIPDFIPLLGPVDDAVIVPAGLWLVARVIPAAVLADCRALALRAEDGSSNGADDGPAATLAEPEGTAGTRRSATAAHRADGPTTACP